MMPYSAEVRLEGTLPDSFPLQGIAQAVRQAGGEAEILSSQIGKKLGDPCRARLRVIAPSEAVFRQLMEKVRALGGMPVEEHEVALKEVDRDGTLPVEFYSTTNFATQVRYKGEWIPVDNPEMDCAIKVDPATRTARTLPMGEARKGDLVVCDGPGIRVIPLDQEEDRPRQAFEFMGSAVSSERPIEKIIREIAEEMRQVRRQGGKVLWVVGPAAVHTGGGKYLAELIRAGYVNVLFGGNAIAAHDIELALFGTALGVDLEQGVPVEKGHEHHLRAINLVRRAGSIRKAVEQGILKSGVMYECVRNGVEFVLAGSIRDDGPIPDVITDVIDAQGAMRRCLPGVKIAVMISTMLHSIATGNMLPAFVKTLCVDINPATVTKLVDRGSHQAFGIVTDVLPFLREMASELCSPASTPSRSRSS